MLSIASAAAVLAGLADPEAHAEHVQAASRLGSAAMWPAGIEFRLHPDGACAWKVVMAGCVVNASLGAGEANQQACWTIRPGSRSRRGWRCCPARR